MGESRERCACVFVLYSLHLVRSPGRGREISRGLSAVANCNCTTMDADDLQVSGTEIHLALI